jgi:hypothetical protein
VIAVEADGEIAREFEVLLLIVADGHEFRLVEQNVCGHEHGIIQESRADRLALLARLVFELRHAFEFADARDAIEYPCQLGMFRHVRLNEDDGDFRIDACGEIDAREVARFLREQFRVLRQSDRVEVDDAEETFVLVLEFDPVAQRAEVVAEVDVAGRLCAAENSFHAGFTRLR